MKVKFIELNEKLQEIQANDSAKAHYIASILTWFIEELQRAEKKHPRWTYDPIHAAAILNEESGEAIKAAIDFYHFDGGDIEKLVSNFNDELVQVGAMAIRTLLHIHDYELNI